MTKTKKSSQHELNLEDNQNNNLEEEYLEINLDTFLFNAGVIGFIEVLEEAKASKGESLEDRKDFYYEGQTLYVNKQFLLNLDFSKYYLKTVYNKFYKNTTLYQILNTNKKDSESIKKYNSFLKRKTLITIADTLKDNKIKELLSNYQDNKDNKEINFKEIVLYINNNEKLKYYLYIANIFYDKFSLIFYNMYFLKYSSRQKTHKIEENIDLYKSINNNFNLTKKYIIEYGKNNLQKNKCIICESKIKKELNMNFLFEIGVDPNKKQSAYWNLQSDMFICHICYMIYSCTPLGFIDMSNLMLFVNQNDSIETLINMNEKIDFINNEDNKTYTVYNEIIRRILAEKTKELKSIQVIVRDKNHYLFNTIGKDSLQIIESRKKELKNISKIKSVKITDDYWIDVYKECLENIFNFRNQWNLIFKLLKIEDNKFILNTIFNILKIQIAKNTIFLNNKTLKEDNNMQKQFDLAYIAYKSGNEIRAKLIGANSSANLNSEQNKEADNKLRGLVYQLINYVHTSNRDLFLSNITRLYAGMNLSIPSIFLNIFKSDDEFKVIGNAYILGLKGSFYDDDSSKNNNDKKDN